jgi:hypothetical protein
MHRTLHILGTFLGGLIFAACMFGFIWSVWAVCVLTGGDCR